MERDGSSTEPHDGGDAMRSEIPRLSDWIWRPWYARLWWAGCALYWGGKLASFLVTPLVGLYESAAAGYLNVAFFPPTILFLLGVGYVGAWMDHYRYEWVGTVEDGIAPKRSLGGGADPYSDPSDPRSGILWIGSPERRAKLYHRRWP